MGLEDVSAGAVEDFPDYVRRGGYSDAAWNSPPDELISVIAESGLRGRGGSGFPTGTKWKSMTSVATPPVVVVNAAESEPASHKDFVLLRLRPHLVIEGALLAGRAIGADSCVFYTHDLDAKQIVDAAWAELMAAGAELPHWRAVVAPRTYVAGEASAAVNFINGRRAIPTGKPPSVRERGVDGRPTLVQNAETLAHVPGILREGSDWFRAAGTVDYPGRLLLSLNGGVRWTGVFEVQAGTPLLDVIRDLGGGAPGGIQAVLPGGYFAGWLAPDALREGVTLDPESLRAAGSDLGSAAITVIPETVCGVWQAARLLRFFANESARQCGPCTFGTAAMADAMERIARGVAREDDLDRLHHYSERMLPRRGACGHLDGATAAARTALRVFADDIASHARFGGCGRPLHCVLPGLEDADDRA
ncbi:MAG TPA: NADH-ubiquinone oxidoreductase-F iron-sulfur binding region domain-containing protein [Thermomicrobiales bacterium]|nr:NADH-ubiquinone oxidoreductase-F iron-sulfur binding region domain-containing protein [Thermomicrobiales bacterium]